MPELIIAENHEQVYPVWEERGIRNAKLTHVDFHCDMRGILIDRKKQKAFFVNDRETQFIDRGNFLAHAIMNGMITDLNWIHGPKGGRSYDIGPVVAYESDYLAPLHRYRHARSGREAVDIKFQQGLLSKWPGPRHSELLDVDWDTFASVNYTAEHRKELIEQFFARDFTHIPELTTLVYSPGYSDPDRSLFHAFADRLADHFQATITHLPDQPLNVEGASNSRLKKLILSVAPQAKAVKQSFSKTWRRLESRNDLAFYAKPTRD